MLGRFERLLQDELELKRYVTPYQSRKTPVYRWYNLNHSYSRNLVFKLLDMFNIAAGDIVLDPFCGTGTTILACRERGIDALGLDIMPLSTFVSRGKLLEFIPEKVASDFKHIYPCKQYDFGFETAAPYLHKCFPHEELTKLLHLRHTISQMSDPEQSFFTIALLNVLKHVSLAKNDGAFLRFKTKVEPKKLEEVFPPQVKMMLEDLEYCSNGHSFQGAVRADARRIPILDDSIGAVITSPPYLNRHDYTRIYAIELLFSFIEDNEQLKRLRYKMLRSNVEARKVMQVEGYTAPVKLMELLNELKKRRLPNRRVLNMIEGYFEDMYCVLSELYRICKRGSQIAFVVGNCKYNQVMFPVDEILAEIGEKIGLSTIKILIARYRGNAPQQMRAFGKQALRESVVIWEKER